MQQDVFLFADSILENIRYGKPGATREEIIEAARLAGAERFISALKDGFDTYVGERGVKLSGGQRQALTLLMATLVRPKLLLLDEHTAALDPKTAAKVLELTEKLVTEQQLTTLMITHNMRDALRYGNRLIMMHDGRPILDVRGEEKAKLTAVDLLQFFEKAGDGVSDKMLLG